jgi:hypothetical protein
MVIISILLGLILKASMESVKRAQERATQALITKLESGLNDRLDALMQNRPDPNSAHLAMASVYNSTYYPNAKLTNNGAMSGYLRAQVIAWYDYIKREMPDTFFVQTGNANYPINFTGTPYPKSGGTTTDQNGLGLYIVPLGNSITSNTIPPLGDGSGTVYNANNLTGLAEYNPTGEGIYGASYPAAAGLYKNLGYQPQGYDAVDNNQNGMIDEYAEGAPDSATQATVQAHLANHNHITARAEMLYAILVEGRGPLGSVFNRDDFTDKEVQDTDLDGLPEFVDAWGNPLQFFRWPILYHSDIQRGQVITSTGGSSWNLSPPYLSIYEQREQDPLDQNQQLVAPAWWSGAFNNSAGNNFAGYPSKASSVNASAGVQAFEYYFHRLTEPYPNAGGANYWDRGTTYGSRRAFYTKFLVLSGGLDGLPGVFLYSDATLSSMSPDNASWALIANENNAMPFSVSDVDFTSSAVYSSTTITYTASLDPTTPSTGDLLQAAQDDITNQTLQTSVGIGGGG